MQLSNNTDGSTTINIVAKSPVNNNTPLSGKVQNIVTIAYKADNNKPTGTYTANIYNVNFNFTNNPTLLQHLISVYLNIEETITGGSPVSPQSFSIAPNPAEKEVVVRGAKDKLLRIYDLDGKQVEEVKLQSDEQVVSISGYGKGVYLMNLLDAGKVTVVEKLIVK